MLKISIVAVGNKMPSWVNEGTDAYLNKIHSNTSVSLIQLGAKKRGKNADISRILQQEGEAILKLISPAMHLICLDRLGKASNSIAFAERITDWQQLGQSIAFVIGGPEGLDSAVLARANETWAFSKMTFSHHVVRVMLAEQLYRAWSITQGLPYHR